MHSRQQTKNLSNLCFSDIVWKDQKIKTAYSKVIASLRDSLESLEAGKLSFNFKGRPVKAVSADVVRIVSELPQNDSLGLALRNIILEGLVSTEDHSVGSGQVFLNALIRGKIPTYVERKPRAEMNEVLGVVRNLIGVGICYEIVKSIISEGAIDSKVDFEISGRDKNFLVKIQSSLKLIGNFHELFEPGRSRLDNCFILAVDGIIESIGEIDCLLQSASVSKQNVLLIARGYSPDVASTLMKNYTKKNMFVFPFVLGGDKKAYRELRESEIYVIDRDSYLTLRTLTIEDISKNSNDVFLDDYMIRIGGVESTSRNVTVVVPHAHKKNIGLIYDRIVIAMRCARESCRTGTCIDTSTGKRVSVKSAINAEKTSRSIKKMLENLGCIILHQR